MVWTRKKNGRKAIHKEIPRLDSANRSTIKKSRRRWMNKVKKTWEMKGETVRNAEQNM